MKDTQMADDNTLSQVLDDDFLLDQIEDLPGFITPPSGAYVVSLPKGIEEKEINDAKYFDAHFTVKEVMEVTEKLKDGEDLPKEGDMFNVIFKRDNKFGMGNFKTVFKSVAEKFNCKTIGEVRENAKGAEFLMVVKRTYNKDKDRHNVNIVRSVLV
jgi:hypothetical protein